MTLRMLKTSLATLRAPLKYIEHGAPQQIVTRMQGNTNAAMRKRVFRRSGGLCECPDCQSGYPVAITMRTFELDHIVPLYQGGSNSITNCRALHVLCHKRITAAQHAERTAMQRTRTWSDGL